MEESVIGERSRLAVSIVKLASRIFLSPFFKINVRGTDNIPEKGSFVLLPKHQRWEDIPLIAISIERPLYFVAKQELFESFFSKRFIASLGGLPINRLQPARSRYTFANVIKKLGEGEGLVIFPEGTYFRNRMGPGYSGFIRMIHSNIDTIFIPVGIRYSNNNIKKTVSIVFGNRVNNTDFINSEELLAYVMNEIAGLSGIKDR